MGWSPLPRTASKCQSVANINSHKLQEATAMKITTVGIDLAKNVLQVHAVDEHGKKVFNKQLRPKHVLSFFVQLPPCLIGLEACSGAHHWARQLQA